MPQEHAGRKVRCPGCQNVFRAPELMVAAAAPEAIPVEPQPHAFAAADRPAPPPLPAEETVEEDYAISERPLGQAPPPLPANDRLEPPPLPHSALDEALDLGLVNHAGEPLPEDDDFFVAAPSEVGRVLSGRTTLKEWKNPWSWPARLAFLLPVLVGCLVILVVLVIHNPVLSWIVLPIMAGWALIVFALTRFSHTCNYVGTQGVAVFRCGGHRQRITKRDIFLFQDAVELRTGQTNMYYNGVYTGTSYNFTWYDDEGKKAYDLSGQYWTTKNLPPAKSPFRFALAAEAAWSGYLAENIDQLLVDQSGLLYFSIGKKDWIRLGNGLVRLSKGGTVVELEADQIHTIGINQGVVSITEVGGKQGWFSSKGVHSFAYKDLGNARFFLFALHKLVGFKLY
ncbi:MAG: hypothetical protein U0793_26075 [Gemmataceae bacterium]